MALATLDVNMFVSAIHILNSHKEHPGFPVKFGLQVGNDSTLLLWRESVCTDVEGLTCVVGVVVATMDPISRTRDGKVKWVVPGQVFEDL